MEDESAPPPQPGAPAAAALGSRYHLVHVGDRLELRDRLFPGHVLGRFPLTAQGRVAAMAELRQLGDEPVGPFVERPPGSGGRPRGSGRQPWTLAVSLTLGVLLAVMFLPRLLPHGSRPLTNAEVLGRMERGTMLVISYAGDVPFAEGSAWIYDLDQGLVVTNAHVVEGGSSFRVGRRGEGFARASLQGAAPCYDLAVLEVSLFPGYEALELAPDDPSRDERVAAMGYPLGAEGAPDEGQPRAAFGNVIDPEAVVTNGPGIDLLVHSAWLGSGDSGGPLVDMHGRLVGVNMGIGHPVGVMGAAAGNHRASFAVPVSAVHEVVPELASGRSVC